MNKRSIKICRYKDCNMGGTVNIELENYVNDGNCYYHTECYHLLKNNPEYKPSYQKGERICRYKNCPYGGQVNIMSEEYAHPVKNMFYHKSCYEALKDQKQCHFAGCKHKNGVNPNSDDCVQDGKFFYHKDCYQIHLDLMEIHKLWHEKISDTVSHVVLAKEIESILTNPNITTKYLVFVLQYAIDHNMPLRYPGGYKYFADNQEIKEAYKKITAPRISHRQFVAKPESEAEPPENSGFALPKKLSGFGSILGGK